MVENEQKVYLVTAEQFCRFSILAPKFQGNLGKSILFSTDKNETLWKNFTHCGTDQTEIISWKKVLREKRTF